MIFEMRSNGFIKTRLHGTGHLITAHLRSNVHNSGKCGSIDVSDQFTDGYSITVVMPLPCTWISSGTLTSERPFVQSTLMARINLFLRTNLIGPEDQVFQKANSDILLAAYRAHNAAVKALVPKDKLLVYRIGEGRVPLTILLSKITVHGHSH